MALKLSAADRNVLMFEAEGEGSSFTLGGALDESIMIGNMSGELCANECAPLLS